MNWKVLRPSELKCQIEWIDKKGDLTHDHNPAVGVAVCITDRDDAPYTNRLYLICDKHATYARTQAAERTDPKKPWPWKIAYFM